MYVDTVQAGTLLNMVYVILNAPRRAWSHSVCATYVAQAVLATQSARDGYNRQLSALSSEPRFSPCTC